MVFLAALCSSRRHGKTSNPKSRSSPLSYQSPEPTPPDHKSSSSAPAESPIHQLRQEHPTEPPPPSPRSETTSDGATLQRVTSSVPLAKSTSTRRKLSGSLSMSIPDGLPRIRIGMKKEQKKEESIWKKTIILGDRCRVPSDDDEDVVLYDENGHRQRNYRPRTPRSLPVSRTNSFIDRDAN